MPVWHLAVDAAPIGDRLWAFRAHRAAGHAPEPVDALHLVHTSLLADRESHVDPHAQADAWPLDRRVLPLDEGGDHADVASLSNDPKARFPGLFADSVHVHGDRPRVVVYQRPMLE